MNFWDDFKYSNIKYFKYSNIKTVYITTENSISFLKSAPCLPGEH